LSLIAEPTRLRMMDQTQKVILL